MKRIKLSRSNNIRIRHTDFGAIMAEPGIWKQIAFKITLGAVNYATTPIAATSISYHIRQRREMPRFLIEERQTEPYWSCTGKTNTGNETVILTSHYSNSEEEIECHRKEARMMNNHLSAKKEFLGYKTGIIHSEDNAQPQHLEAALKDPGVSSIVLIGHATAGSWMTTSGNVERDDVFRWVKEAGHCKNGFGLKAGCNIIEGLPQDEWQLLVPAYSHRAHPGELVIVKGHLPKPYEYHLIPEEVNNQLPKGLHSEANYGIELNTRLIRLKAQQE